MGDVAWKTEAVFAAIGEDRGPEAMERVYARFEGQDEEEK
jgi:hypothetical protein